VALGGSAPRRYAEAIFDIATAERSVDAFRSTFDQLAKLDPAAVRMLGDPSVPLERRLRAADVATAGQPAPVRGLLALLVRRHRVALLPAIADAYGELVDERAGVAKARITTAIELDKAQRRGLVRRLEQATGKTIRATFGVDPELIGGARVQVGDHLVDASLRARLAALREQLAG
jgi:F-type H+-transporting ATPase subunit delta